MYTHAGAVLVGGELQLVFRKQKPKLSCHYTKEFHNIKVNGNEQNRA
jgi:hypothetical protein